MIHHYLFEHMWLCWILITLFFLILEISLGSFFLICMAIGAFVTMFGSLLQMSFLAQFSLFAMASFLSVYMLRPAIMRWLHRPNNERASNVDALIGRQGVVIESITENDYGYVKVDGDEWRAVSLAQIAIPVGSKVEIVSMDSLIVTVKPI